MAEYLIAEGNVPRLIGVATAKATYEARKAPQVRRATSPCPTTAFTLTSRCSTETRPGYPYSP